MHNLNVNLAAAAASAVNNLLQAETATTTTLRTPEILNTVMSMTNPMDNYHFDSAKGPLRPNNNSSDSNSSSCSQMDSSNGENNHKNSPPSVQQMTSQMIKDGLKLTIKQKRKYQNDFDDDLFDLDSKCCKRIKKNEMCSESEDDRNKPDGLTPEDEERRRRRRERNKIAATKCRLKKREKTANLVSESETLEAQNIDLKNQLQALKKESRTLMDMLNAHRPRCVRNIPPTTTSDAIYRLPSIDAYQRPPADEYGTSQQLDDCYNPRNYNNRYKPPSIVVEEPPDTYQPQITNLDNNSYYNNHYANQSNYTDNGCMA